MSQINPFHWIFFFWGYEKDQGFRPKVGSVVELCAEINSTVACVTP
jgi:hypothetical protein